VKDTSSIPTSHPMDADELWKVSWTYIRTVVDTVREPFLILNEDLQIISVNKTFLTTFQVTRQETEKKMVFDLGNGQWNIPKLRTLIYDILPKDTHFEDFEVEHEFPKIGCRVMILNGRRIYTANQEMPIILLAMEDITKQKRLEDLMKEHTQKLTSEVAKRTAELEAKVVDLERVNKMMVDREIKMIELKKELENFKRNK
jgi:two-component system, chemotaxis family, CheB/CheR fusion protein